MAQEQEWQEWKRTALNNLGEIIAWSSIALNASEVAIKGSKHYGTALLVHSIECALAIRLCTHKNLHGPAAALARPQYEGALRGHIIIQEMDLTEINDLLVQTQKWSQRNQSRQSPPRIELRRGKWRCIAPKTTVGTNDGGWRSLKCETAKLWQGSVVDMGSLHDLTHSGLTQALQMVNEDGTIGPAIQQ